MASVKVDLLDWSHLPPYTGQYPLSSTYCILQFGLQITRLDALSEPRSCDLLNARPTHCLCGHSGYMFSYVSLLLNIEQWQFLTSHSFAYMNWRGLSDADIQKLLEDIPSDDNEDTDIEDEPSSLQEDVYLKCRISVTSRWWRNLCPKMLELAFWSLTNPPSLP